MSSEPQESYSTPGFAEFYDRMVAQLPPEAGADVQHVCWPLLRELATGDCSSSLPPDSEAGSSSPCGRRHVLTVLDMCTGSGRVAQGLAARWAAWDCAPPGAQLAVVGVDSSSEMLAAARAKAAAAAAASGACSRLNRSGGATGRCELSWQLGDMQAFMSVPQPSVPPASCALAILAAGSFHHLLTPSDQAATLRGLAACLRHLPAAAFAVLSLLGPEHLAAEAGQVTLAGPYRRTCLAAAREPAPGGGMLWRHRFRLLRYASAAAAAQGDSAALQWEREEGWALREVAPAELERLVAAAELRVVRRQALWSDGWGGAAPECAAGAARVFVLALDRPL